MTKTKSTKKALFMSMLSLLLCVAMLIGSTFAWFTDSVTSGRNRIVAGNLDIELYRGTETKETDKVTEATKLFENGVDGETLKWEPGVVAYENFTVKNEGSLALKYSLALTVYDNNVVEGTEASLADVIKVAFLNRHFDGTREEAQALTDYQPLKTTAKTGALLPEDKDAARASEQFAVVLYWQPGENDNDYNLNNGKTSSDKLPLWIDLGVNLQATQTPYEADSFDENYDATAEFPDAAFVIAPSEFSVAPNMEGETVIGNDAVNVKIPEGALTTGDEIVLEVTPNSDVASGVTVKADEKSVSYDIGLYTKATHSEVHPTKDVTVKLFIGKNLSDVTVYHEGALMSSGVSYDHETGYLTFETSDFSPFDIIYRVTIAEFTNANGEVTLYGTLEGISNAIGGYGADSGDVMKLVRDIDVTSLTYRYSSFFNINGAYNGDAVFQGVNKGTFDGDHHTITMPSGIASGWVFLDVKSGATVKNLNVVLNGGCTGVARSGNEFTYENVNVKGKAELDGNGGLFIIYAIDSITPPVFKNCVSEAIITGTGYNAIFVGYPRATGLTFEKCYNRGSIFCDEAAMFFANPTGDKAITRVFTITDCKNEGLVHSINNTDYGKRNLFASVASGNMIEDTTTVIINGKSYTGAQAVALDTKALGLGNPIEISKEDPRLEIKRSGNDFIIVPASELDVAYYVLEYDTYAHVDAAGSTSRKFISWKFQAEKNATEFVADLKFYSFVDKEWIKANKDAEVGKLLGYTTYTKGGVTYYELPDLDNCFYKSHDPNPGDNCVVKAYDTYGNVLTSVGFAITSGKTSSKG